MAGIDILNSILGGGSKQAPNADYARGYADCEKKYKQIEAERNAAMSQLQKLGYVLGEAPDVLKSASSIKKDCRSRTSGCDGCNFQTVDGCSLEGKNPSEWRIL